MDTTNDDVQIIAYCCHYCAYAAADLAGSIRLEYPAAVKVVELPCSARFDPLYALKALEDGADGVMVAGCMPGDCHFLEGNLQARRRVEATQKILEEIGFEPERLYFLNISASMGKKFAVEATNFTDVIRRLGPNPLTNGQSPVENRRST